MGGGTIETLEGQVSAKGGDPPNGGSQKAIRKKRKKRFKKRGSQEMQDVGKFEGKGESGPLTEKASQSELRQEEPNQRGESRSGASHGEKTNLK